MKESYVVIAKILKPQGNKGELKLKEETEDSDWNKIYKNIYLCKPSKERILIEVENFRYQKGFPVIKIKGIDNLSEAEALRGSLLEVKREDLPPLPQGHYYISKIIGLPVFSMKGELLGVLREVLKTPANDIYVVEKDGKEILLPALKSVVREVDMANGRIIVSPLEEYINED